MNIGGSEILVIVVVALLVFGPGRIPEIGRTVGKALREFRAVASEVRKDLSLSDSPTPPKSNRGRGRIIP